MAVLGGTGGLPTSGASLGPLVDKPPVPPNTPIDIDLGLSTLLLWVYAIRTVLALDRELKHGHLSEPPTLAHGECRAIVFPSSPVRDEARLADWNRNLELQSERRKSRETRSIAIERVSGCFPALFEDEIRRKAW